jgi:chromosome segregation ATPase
MCGLVGGWTAILFAALRWSLSRNLKSLEEKITDASSGSAKALTELSELRNKLTNVPITCNGHNFQTGRLDGHSDRLAQHKELLTAIEADLKHLPKNSDIGKLHDKINGVNQQLSIMQGELGKVAGAMPGLTHVTEMMNEFLLNHGGK